MQRYISFIILCLCGVFVFLLSPSASTSQQHSDSAAELIGALDDCIQQRFLDVDKGFGFRRIIRPGDTAHRFKPENAKELAVVEYLSGTRLDVVLYLAGRGILASKLNSEEVDGVAGNLIKGPVLITTSDKQVAGLPAFKQLWDHGREAMQVFQGSNRYDFNLGEWSFTARPVRASDTTCLNCHQGNGTTLFSMRNNGRESNSLQKGDPLGLLVYGYRRSQQ